MKENTGVVFIHGAGLAGWIWQDVNSQLSYPAWIPDFPERDPSRPVPKSYALDDYVLHCLNSIREIKCQRIVLVAHSIGGLVALKLAEHFGEHLTGFIGVGAAIPKNGGSYLSVLPFSKQLLMNIILRIAGTKPPKSTIIQGLCNDLSPDKTEIVVEQFVAESPNLYFNNCNVPIPKTKTLYVKLNNDAEFPQALQNKMINNLQADQIATLDAGHLPMLSCPNKLAVILNDFLNHIKDK